ncbi:MAG: 23S rRNA (adenine(2030)-N(6))-methyltransferase RlmJ [Dokdonella sp.]
MNYRHAFHAGNFADVFKHVVLIGLLDAIKMKSTPFCFLDTHAGRGRYDLGANESVRTGEHTNGIQRLLGAEPANDESLPILLRDYLQQVRKMNDGSSIRHYPGSPLLASMSLRARDRAQLCELQSDEAAALKALFRNDARIGVHHRDGYASLKALLPPQERRGLVLIDPPFEAQEAEFALIETALRDALARWPTGTYAIWYPIKLSAPVLAFQRRLSELPALKKLLIAELLIHPANSPLRLNGCGMAIINPPWQFDRNLAETLPVLARILAQSNDAQHRLAWLLGDS